MLPFAGPRTLAVGQYGTGPLGGTCLADPGEEVTIEGEEAHPARPAPGLGVDSEAVLAEAGYDNERIACLRADSIIRPRSAGDPSDFVAREAR